MANVDAPRGMWPIEHLNGMPWNGAVRRAYVAAASADIGVGDPVTWSGAGQGNYMEVDVATAGDGNKITGVVVFVEPQPTALEQIYIASGASGWIHICCDPDVIFGIQGCSGSALSAATIGLNAVLIKTHSTSTTTGLSGVEMDSGATTAPAGNGSYQLLIVGAIDREDNDITAVNADWKVLISLHSFRAVDANAGGAAEGAKGV